MNFWWVNHNQTFRHEFEGGYVWSPKTSAGGKQNPFYDFMRQVCPGDIVFSFSDTRIQGFGVAMSHCYTSPRPNEFGRIGEVWDKVGWRVDVDFRSTIRRIRPKDHIEVLRRVLPAKYSPLQETGNGNQGVYLTSLTLEFAEVLCGLIGSEAAPLLESRLNDEPPRLFEVELKGVDEWEQIEVNRIQNAFLPETERQALVRARIGQGRFKENVFRHEYSCRVTCVRNPVHLVASHIKPWRESNNDERLAAGNGLLLTPSIDHLFDRGFISFADTGETLISRVADQDSLARMGVDSKNPPQVGSFNIDQRHFLEHHRRSVFLGY